MQYHEGTVTWTLRVDVPRGAPPGDYPIRGVVGYQACEYGKDGNNICEPLKVSDQSSASAAPMTFAPADSYSQVAAIAATFANFLDGQSSSATASAAQRAADDNPVLRAANQYDLEMVQVEAADGTLAYYIALA
jgi:hypothetical protein